MSDLLVQNPGFFFDFISLDQRNVERMRFTGLDARRLESRSS